MGDAVTRERDRLGRQIANAARGGAAVRGWAAAIGRGLEAGGLRPPDLCPVADGGEGTVDAVVRSTGGEFITRTVSGPLGEPVEVAQVERRQPCRVVVHVGGPHGRGVLHRPRHGVGFAGAVSCQN